MTVPSSSTSPSSPPRAIVGAVLAAAFVLMVAPDVAAQSDPGPGAPPPPPPGYTLDPALEAGDRPLTVDEVVDRALAAAPTVDEARAQATAADAAIRETKAALWPRLDVTARYRRVDGFPDGSIGVPGGEQVVIEIPRNQTALEARLTMPLTDELFRVLPLLRSTEAQREAERLEVIAARADVRARAEKSYWRWVEARAALAVAEAAVAHAAEQRARVEALSRGGFATEADVLAALSQEALTGEIAARARGAYDVASRSLAVVARLDEDPRERSVGDTLTETPPMPDARPDVLVERAFASRAELRALDLAIDAQDGRADAARARAYPSVDLFAGVQYANPNQNVIPPQPEWNDSWEVGVQLGWSPNDLVAGTSAEDRERANGTALIARREAVRDAVRLEVEQALADWRAARGALDAAVARERAAAEAHAARRAQLAAGEAVVTELLDADLEQTQARLARLQATTAVQIAASDLRRAVGEE
jgi:outer membrane protein